MKKICLFTLLFLIALPLFAAGTTEEYQDSALYKVGNASVLSSSVNSIDIEWTSGNVTITGSDSDIVSVSSDNPDMHYLLKNGCLYVKFTASRAKKSNKIQRYNLIVSLPMSMSLHSFDLDLGLGELNMNLAKCSDIDIEVGVGNSLIKLASVPREMDIESGNGDMTLYFPENSLVTMTAPFGIGGRDISENIKIVKESDLEVEVGVGNLTIR